MATIEIIIVSREEARERGLKHFRTCEPCIRSHYCDRITSSGQCIECAKELYGTNKKRKNLQAKVRYQQNKKQILANNRKWAIKNPESVRAASRRYYYKNREARLEYRREYGKKNRDRERESCKHWFRDNPEKSRAISQRAYKKNRTAILERAKKYRIKNLDIVKERYREWSKNNKEIRRSLERNRKARKRGNGGSHTANDIADILKMQGGKCALCRVKLNGKYCVDHIVALANGGRNDRKNLQCLCSNCNLQKGAKDQIEYMQSLGKLL